MSKKEIVKTETRALQTQMEAPEQEVVASDVLIPRLLLMQGMSAMVASRKAQLGDVIRSTTTEKVGDPENSVDVVPLKLTPAWINFEVLAAGAGKPKFRGMEPRNAKNENLPWEYETEDGTPMKRQKAYILYALLPGDLAAYEAEMKACDEKGTVPDLTKTVLPVVITFQSTSFKHAGKKIASFFTNVRKNAERRPGLEPYNYVLNLLCKEEKNDKGMYFVWDAGNPRALADNTVKTEAASWSKRLNAGNIKVDDAEELADGDV